MLQIRKSLRVEGFPLGIADENEEIVGICHFAKKLGQKLCEPGHGTISDEQPTQWRAFVLRSLLVLTISKPCTKVHSID